MVDRQDLDNIVFNEPIYQPVVSHFQFTNGRMIDLRNQMSLKWKDLESIRAC